MRRLLRADDPRIVTAGILAALTAALWIAAWSAMGQADFAVVELCRSVLTGAPLSEAASADLAALGALADGSPTARLVVETCLMWLLMMAAMMLPAMTGVVAVYADVARIEDRGLRLALRVGLFTGAYFALWALFALVAAAAQLALRGAAVFTLDGAVTAPVAAAALLILAGGWQFTRIKQSCLVKCRQPMAFLMAEWRPGLRGAARIGARHGLYCLGCCAALMGLMFVFGAMNLWWMAAIAIYCAAEKLAPRAEIWGKYAGAAMIAGGLWMLAAQA